MIFLTPDGPVPEYSQNNSRGSVIQHQEGFSTEPFLGVHSDGHPARSPRRYLSLIHIRMDVIARLPRNVDKSLSRSLKQVFQYQTSQALRRRNV